MSGQTALVSEDDVLTELYGAAVTPQPHFYPQELHNRPSSIEELNDVTAATLKGYMELSLKGRSFPSLIHRQHPILWVINKKGVVRFSLEEVISADNANFVCILGGGLPLEPGYVKLGHPALVEDADKKARIGGEIKFSPTAARWLITNRSGRYGILPNRKKEHLENAADRFRQFGIDLDTSFWGQG